MNHEEAIERTIQRTRRYWYEDGLTEIAAGAIFLAIGLMFVAEAVGLLGPLGPGVSSLGLVAIVLGGGWLGRRAVVAMKERLTYRRTGYVANPRRRGVRSRVATAIVAGGMGALVSLLLVTAPASQALNPALQGLIVGGALLYFGYNLGLGRFVALAGFSALAGVSCSWYGLGDLLGSGVYFGSLGLVTMVSGAAALAFYLRQTRALALGEG